MSANESKRRTEHRSLDIRPFQYEPLDEGIDCTRFLKIHPARNDNGPISCDLVQIAFGARPSYEALSYRWGDETYTNSILLNGSHFLVGRNLYDALQYLRNQGGFGLLWVDAICIDQKRVQERNKQVAIMRHIYFRAQTVVIWLGKLYSEYQQGIDALELRHAPGDVSVNEALGCSTDSNQPDDAHTAGLKVESKMVLRLAKDEYWKRLWIVQEIGLARHRRVCFGNMAMNWNSFIKMMTLHSTDGEGPLLLNQQIESKYEGAHTMRSLLYEHRFSQCKDPKDKIFGLIGLAVDGHGFPKPDYDKSPVQIWTDTMEFMNEHDLFDQDKEVDIIFYGTLVKFLLMGTRSTLGQQVLGPCVVEAETQLIHASGPFAETKDSRVFTLTGYVVGCIQSIGPSTKDIADNLGKVDEWSFKVQVNYRNDLGAAYEQSNNLLRALLTKEDAEVSRLCFNQTSLVEWTALANSGTPLGEYSAWFANHKHELKPPENPSLSDSSSTTKATADTNQLLYQLYTGYCKKARTKWKMGVASGQAELGDLAGGGKNDQVGTSAMPWRFRASNNQAQLSVEYKSESIIAKN
ncbi:HET domain-containing protein [Colletotrichum orchidophilum]|uniref:HET domain-containing protein n=1 Tax=Colletotrichum orchidophilum TaxID=1209926 RepID=A0A1G4BNR1_9PEZI|nr:HET domain-containing protein [Colletotrichum orchidophilum]OHF02943.1 HET domain-containing protein [Colletotrichum orchidophilum]